MCSCRAAHGADPGLLVLRFDGPLYTANVRGANRRLLAAVDERDCLDTLVLDTSALAKVTLTVIDEFAELERELAARDVTLWIAAVPPRGSPSSGSCPAGRSSSPTAGCSPPPSPRSGPTDRSECRPVRPRSGRVRLGIRDGSRPETNPAQMQWAVVAPPTFGAMSRLPALSVIGTPTKRTAMLDVAAEADRLGFAGLASPGIHGNLALCGSLAHVTARIPFWSSIQPIYHGHPS